jgi:hypothetical protein
VRVVHEGIESEVRKVNLLKSPLVVQCQRASSFNEPATGELIGLPAVRRVTSLGVLVGA